MKRTSNSDELNTKKIVAKNDFTLLSQPGLIGNYVECEFTHIVIESIKTKELHHYFGIISYEEFVEPNTESRNKRLSTSKRNLDKDYKIGILQFRVSLDEAQEIFEQLFNGALTYQGTRIHTTSELVCLPKAFVSHLWGIEPPIISKVLKPTVFGDSYIIEYLSHTCSIETMLTRPAIKKANKFIMDALNIDLDSISDRIGSFIFQFPISTLETKIDLCPDQCSAVITVESENELFQNDDIETLITTRFDNLVTGFAQQIGYVTNQRLDIGDSHSLEFFTFNRRYQLILSHNKYHFIRSVIFGIGVSGAKSEPRKIVNNGSGDTTEISLYDYSLDGINTGEPFDTRTRKRILQNDILSKRGRFKVFEGNQRKEALEYFRELINSEQSSEIWLIDPFLIAQDLLDTVYHCSRRNVHIKCLSSLKKANQISVVSEDLKNFRCQQINDLMGLSNSLGLNLEWKVVHDSHGKPFHDRYLMLIPSDKKAIPTIYSLGTSINSLGDSHHLIQRVLDPKELEIVLRDLWLLLDKPCCTITKIENGKFI